MGLFSRFERHMEDGFEGAADKMFDAPISPVQISKKAEKAMRREKMVGAGKQYAPTLYTVLVNPQDDQRLFGYYPTLAGETETYLAAKASEEGLLLDGQPLVRFIVDDDLKRGKFDIIAEMVSAPIIQQLRDEEMNRYGIGGASMRGAAGVPQQAAPAGYDQFSRQAQQPHQAPRPQAATPQPQPQPQASPFVPSSVADENPERAYDVDYHEQPLPYVPEEEIDRSLDYGEYTFDSQDFQGGQNGERHGYQAPQPQAAAPYQAPQAAPQSYQAAPQQPMTGVFNGNAAGYAAGPAGFGANQAGVQAQQAILTNMVSNRVYNLTPGTIVLGRGTDCDIAVSDINASRTHAEITCQGPNVWVITDLGSTNGTKVNGQHVSSQTLQEGDRITIGMTNYLFSLR